jgi:ion channel
MFEERLTRPALGFWQAYHNCRFGILLALLLSLIAGPALVLNSAVSAGWFDEVMAVLLLGVVASLGADRRQRLFAGLLGVPTILISLCGHRLPVHVSEPVVFIGHVCQMAFLFGAAVLIVRSLFTTYQLSLDSLFGAVCGYLFVGLGFAVGHSLCNQMRPGSYQVNPSLVAAGDSTQIAPQILSYYSFVTLTTVGYGDVTPIGAAARTLTWMEAIVGQFYLAVVVAGIVSMIVAAKDRANAPAQT